MPGRAGRFLEIIPLLHILTEGPVSHLWGKLLSTTRGHCSRRRTGVRGRRRSLETDEWRDWHDEQKPDAGTIFGAWLPHEYYRVEYVHRGFVGFVRKLAASHRYHRDLGSLADTGNPGDVYTAATDHARLQWVSR